MATETVETSEFECCEHIDEAECYCNNCKIFTCDDCAFEHIEHLDAIDSYPNFVKKYLRKADNIQSRAKLLLRRVNNRAKDKDSEGSGSQKEHIFKLIDNAFVELVQEIEMHKDNMREEIWKEISKAQGTNTGKTEQEETEEFINTSKDFELSVIEIRKWENEERSPIIKSMQQNIINKIELQIKKQASKKTGMGGDKFLQNEIAELKITPKVSYSDVTKLFKLSVPFLPEDKTQDYYFPNGSRIWRKGGNKGEETWDSLCCPVQLPLYFRAKFRIKKFIKSTFCLLGVAQKNFQLNKGHFLGWSEGQWGCSEEGFVCSNEGGKRIWKHGNVKCGKDRDVISVVYEKFGGLTFEVNGQKQPIGFPLTLKPPLYLCVSLFFRDSIIELIELTKLLS